VLAATPIRRPSLRTVIAHPGVAGLLALRLLLDDEPDIVVAGEARDLATAVRLVADLGATYLVAHDSLLTWPRDVSVGPGVALVVLGMERHPSAAVAAKRGGAAAYVQWDRASDDLPGVLLGLAVQPACAAGA
jgi:hypothetical protein